MAAALVFFARTLDVSRLLDADAKDFVSLAGVCRDLRNALSEKSGENSAIGAVGNQVWEERGRRLYGWNPAGRPRNADGVAKSSDDVAVCHSVVLRFALLAPFCASGSPDDGERRGEFFHASSMARFSAGLEFSFKDTDIEVPGDLLPVFKSLASGPASDENEAQTAPAAISLVEPFAEGLRLNGRLGPIEWPACDGSIGRFFGWCSTFDSDSESATRNDSLYPGNLPPELQRPIRDLETMAATGAVEEGIRLCDQIGVLLSRFEPGRYNVKFQLAMDEWEPRGLYWPTTRLDEAYMEETYMFATQSESSLDDAVAERYVDAIRQGARPVVFLCQTRGTYGDYYVLDGHHKLSAYCACDRIPAVVIIKHSADPEDGPSPAQDQIKEDLQPRGWVAQYTAVYPEMA
jgi:hypothetical protein